VRRLLIQNVLPLILCLLPVLATVLIALAAPDKAREFYLARVRESYIDWIILGLGLALFFTQLFLAWQALQWRGTAFNERPDRLLTHLAQAAEWFPLLGLIGTVAGILETFSEIAKRETILTREIIELYAPAITATGSGLFMALINIFPTWIVILGRDLILSLGGSGSSPPEEMRP
jgi:hypothetical protein